MIKQLRQSFLIAAFSSVFITLLVLIATINIINYRNVLKEADGTLTMLIENDGQFPSPEQMIGQERPPMDMFNEETPFETRFFVVTLDENGQSVQTQTSQIAAIDQKAAESYGKQVFKESSDRGFIDSYRFHKVTEKTGTTVYFLDCHRSLINFYSFLRASLIVSAIGFLIVAVLLLFFSKKIMAPVIESYEKQKRFITDAGHELKTPLATIQADADVLSLQENNEWIDDIHVQVDKMSKLTNELIELAKMEEMDDRSAFVDFPISDIVSESAERFLTKARAQKKELTLDIEKGLVAHGDPNQIEKAVDVLLDNAIQYSTDASTITLSLHKKNKRIHLSVQNRTDQLKQEDLAHLFDRFYRKDSSRNSSQPGYGIGLSIVSAIAQNHQGTITPHLTGDLFSIEMIL